MSDRILIHPEGHPVPDEHFVPGIKYGNWVFVSGTTASDYRNGLLPDAAGNAAVPLAGEAPLIREARTVVKTIDRVLKMAGTGLENGVRLDQFPADRAIMDPYHVVRRDEMKVPRPVSASVHVNRLLSPQAKLAVELLALIPGMGLEREPIVPKDIPAAIQGFTPAVRVGDYVFLAGQVASDFVTGLAPEARINPDFWEGSAIEVEARYTLENMERALKAAGSSLKNVVKTTVYLSDINDLSRLDRVWREMFPTDPPARTVYPITTFGVADIRLEISMVAVTDQGKVKKEVVHTDRAAKPLFHESQAIRAGDFLFLSGLLAADENGLVQSARRNSSFPYGRPQVAAEMENIMEQASAICEAAGTKLSRALRLFTVHTDLCDYHAATSARVKYFPDGQPTFSVIEIPGPLQVPGCTLIGELWVAT